MDLTSLWYTKLNSLHVAASELFPVFERNNVLQTQHMYSLFRLATCFDFTGSSSGLHCEPIEVLRAAYILGIPNNVFIR